MNLLNLPDYDCRAPTWSDRMADRVATRPRGRPREKPADSRERSYYTTDAEQAAIEAAARRSQCSTWGT